MYKLLKEAFRTGNVTVRYPFAPLPAAPNFRGKPHYEPERCIACAACTIACPANALTMTTDPAAGTRTWEICFGRCVFCGRCEEVCPTQAIALSPEFEMAVLDRGDLYQTAEFTLASCRRCDTPFAPRKEIDYVVALLVNAGLPEADAERRRAMLEVCPACKRYSEVVREAGSSGSGWHQIGVTP
jgi:hydrogenase-4 component H